MATATVRWLRTKCFSSSPTKLRDRRNALKAILAVVATLNPKLALINIWVKGGGVNKRELLGLGLEWSQACLPYCRAFRIIEQPVQSFAIE